jgi:two-component system OmpR family response regulator
MPVTKGQTMRLLVVEDEKRMADVLRRGLVAEGYAVDVVGTAEDGQFMGEQNDYDGIVMDVNLPDGDGFDVCRALRAAGRWSPIIVLTAREAVEDRVRGLDVGADDYLVKPFSFAELAARLRALVRRGSPVRPARIQVGDVALDPAAHTITVADRPMTLTAREYALLELLLRRAGETLTRSEILEHVWDWAFDGTSNVVDVYVGYLRQKLGSGAETPVIETLRGVGYRLVDPASVRSELSLASGSPA